MKDFVGHIQKYQDSFSKTEKKIAEYLIQNLEQALTFSVEDLARATGTSGATVVRFCRTMGFRGFMDFKFQMERNVLYVIEQEQLISREDRIPEIKNKIIQYSIGLMNEVRDSLDDGALERACDAIVSAKRVIVFAEGGSATMADFAKTSFIHTGVYCHVETDASIQIMAAQYVTREDTVIGMTHSGRIGNTIEALAAAKKLGAKTIAITGTYGTPICEHADIVLACNINHPFDLSDFQGSRLEEFCVLSILQMGTLLKTYEKSTQIARKVSEAAEARRVPAHR